MTALRPLWKKVAEKQNFSDKLNEKVILWNNVSYEGQLDAQRLLTINTAMEALQQDPTL